MYYVKDRDARIGIFNDTMRICETDDYVKIAVAESVKKQRLILENDKIKNLENAPLYKNKSKLVISKKRSFEAASTYAYDGKKVCLLNFASATNPGGGVTIGSSAQEECLCRCSTLYPCINDDSVRRGFHIAHRKSLRAEKMTALYNNDCIYTPGILMVKSDTYKPELMEQSQWFKCDVITCAAPNLRQEPSNLMNPGSGKTAIKINNDDLKSLHTERANRILDIAKANKAEVVILGAFGCGAFQNPPEVVAEGIKRAVKNHIYDFETIEFAIYSSRNDRRNYDAFSMVLNEEK